MAKVNTFREDEDLKIKFGKKHLSKIGQYLKPYKNSFIFTLFLRILT